MVQSFNVETITATPNAKVPGYVVKIQSKVTTSAVTVLGSKTSTKQSTYYMKVNEPSVKVGQSVDLDPEEFTIVTRPFTIPLGMPDAGTVVDLKWLQL